VVTASTVAQAKRVAASSDFDLLIGDIGLPDGDGTEVVKAFNRVQRAPSIAVTGYGTREDRQKCTLAGFTAHLTKPVNFDRLTEMIQTVCDEARSPS
jgi:CheY-like chemotaxis protein